MNTELNKNTFDKNTLIKPLSQNDLAVGWRLVVPRVRRITKTYKDDHDNVVSKQGYNIYRSKVNLAQLPYYLWSKSRVLRIINQFTKLEDSPSIRVNDMSHHYFITPTNVDQEIKELVSLINKPFDNTYKETISNLVNILKDNNVYGWPVIIASSKNNL